MEYFTFTGRIGRKSFVLRTLASLAVTILWFIGVFILVVGADSLTDGTETAVSLAYILMAFLLFVVMIPLAWFNASLSVLRLHDLGQSGWWYVAFLLIPVALEAVATNQGAVNVFNGILSFAWLGYLAFVKGEVGVNKYGAPQDYCGDLCEAPK